MFSNLFPLMFVCAFVIGLNRDLTIIEVFGLCNDLMWVYMYFFKIDYNCSVCQFMAYDIRLCTRKRFSIRENYLLYWGI